MNIIDSLVICAVTKPVTSDKCYGALSEEQIYGAIFNAQQHAIVSGKNFEAVLITHLLRCHSTQARTGRLIDRGWSRDEE